VTIECFNVAFIKYLFLGSLCAPATALICLLAVLAWGPFPTSASPKLRRPLVSDAAVNFNMTHLGKVSQKEHGL
jgi:hypothetical protein